MMPAPDTHHLQAGPAASLVGVFISGYNWFVGGMSPMAVVCTALTMVWTVIQIWKHVKTILKG